MKAVSTIKEIKSRLNQLRKSGKSIGFVPTMGALHRGHISLVEKAKQENDIVVVSIFVNPTQFNDKKDLLKYPRTPEKDLQMLEAAGVDLVFIPEALEIYPEGEPEEKFDFGNLEKVMEGAHRPGHFLGVARVVAKLFRIVTPDRAYFGEKDFQQLVIIKKLAENFFPDIKVIGCPTVREKSGLAMSSRNMLLDEVRREVAGIIYGSFAFVEEFILQHSIVEIKAGIKKYIEYAGHFKLEYFEIANENTLEPIEKMNDGIKSRAFIAVKAGDIRLIDNVSLIPNTKVN